VNESVLGLLAFRRRVRAKCGSGKWEGAGAGAGAGAGVGVGGVTHEGILWMVRWGMETVEVEVEVDSPGKLPLS